MEIKKFAAIDIGSNSIRLLIEHVMESPQEVLFKKNALIRVPIRLGSDAFINHEIPHTTVKKLVEAMLAYKHLMNVNDVIHYKGCATSAMREATNGEAIIKKIKRETGINIEIISGNSEANMIFASQNAFAKNIGQNCIFVDVGGGSTEITIFAKEKVVTAKSFDIGTIRLLNEQVEKEDWKELKDWLKREIKPFKSFTLVGSGGNINRLFKMAQIKQGKPMPFETLNDLYNQLKPFSIEDRMRVFDLNPDRADVIVPAAIIFLNIMKWIDASKIFVPKIGLSDGLVREAYYEYKVGKNK